MRKGRSQVAWDVLCKTKEEGGLGFADLSSWNRTALSKHLWHLLVDNGPSLWVRWVKMYLLTGRSIWSIKKPGNSSWSWRKIWS